MCRCFDRFEYLFALVQADLTMDQKGGIAYWPGRFWWRNRLSEMHISTKIGAEFEREKGNWPLLQTGLFHGSPERFTAVKAEVDRMNAQLPWG